ncbi:MAG TPA: SRPBCC family protein [Thermomicrobiales bacterium]|nr:SRPBCC family protein [Thermomicrobiales bacterium]
MEYQRSRRIRVTPDSVFAFVTDVSNLPTYVPTVQSVETLTDGRIRVHGNTGGTSFEADLWTHVDHNQRGIEWGTDERDRHGWMTVTAADDDADMTEVVAHVSWPPHVNQDAAPLAGERAEEPDPIEDALEAALDSLRNILEGTGGKERPESVS